MTKRHALVVLVMLLMAATARGATLGIRPIDFGSGQTARGTITVADDTGDIIDWHLEVVTVERLARYRPANTPFRMVDQVMISGDGVRMTVATSPDSIDDGGALGFRAQNPSANLGTWIANFSGPAVDGGQALYMAGAAFEYLDLNQPPGRDYLVARAGDGHRYDLVPVAFSDGVTMWGSIVTDGRTGVLDAAGIVDWDIVVDMVSADVFTPANSRLASSLTKLSPDGRTLTVDNADGSLMFVKGVSGGHLYALQLADFSDASPRGGQAGYYRGRLSVDLVPLGAPRGPWVVTGSDTVPAVPEPAAFGLVAVGLALLGTARRHFRR